MLASPAAAEAALTEVPPPCVAVPRLSHQQPAFTTQPELRIRRGANACEAPSIDKLPLLLELLNQGLASEFIYKQDEVLIVNHFVTHRQGVKRTQTMCLSRNLNFHSHNCFPNVMQKCSAVSAPLHLENRCSYLLRYLLCYKLQPVPGESLQQPQLRQKLPAVSFL